MCCRAYVNGIEVTVYDFQDEKALCFIPEIGVKSWYRLNEIEVRSV